MNTLTKRETGTNPLAERIAEAAARLRAARPEATVILYGSHARGDARPDSDVDFLMVYPQKPASAIREMVELTDLLRPLRLRAEVLVASLQRLKESAAVPGTFFSLRGSGRTSALWPPLTKPDHFADGVLR